MLVRYNKVVKQAHHMTALIPSNISTTPRKCKKQWEDNPKDRSIPSAHRLLTGESFGQKKASPSR